MKRMHLLLLGLAIFCSPLFSQEALLLFRSNANLPLLLAMDEIMYIRQDDSLQTIALKDSVVIIETPLTEIDSLIFAKPESLNNYQYICLDCPDDNHPHIIDMGLPSGTKWACCNISASFPEDYGGHYAWGETAKKSDYRTGTYQYASMDDENGWWYDEMDGHYYTYNNIGNDIGGTSYDVAHVKWGRSWRMPTFEQILELYDYSKKKWINQNGINGFRVEGFNGGVLFLPAGGCFMDESLNGKGEEGHYWSSSTNPNDEASVYGLMITSRGWGWGNCYRCYGRSVRAVCP